MIVPGGGLSPDGNRWVACRSGFFLHARVPSRLFRRLFLEGFLALHHAGELAFFGDLAGLSEPQAFAVYLAPLRKIERVVHAKPPFGGPEAVLAYLSRYTHPLPGSGLHGKPREGCCDFQQSPRQRRCRDGGVSLEGLQH